MDFGTLTSSEINLLLTICLFETAVGLWLWRQFATAHINDEKSLTPQQRTTIYFYVLALLLALVIAVTLGGILSHFDRDWYALQGALDTGNILSPAHYYIFLICYPVYITVGACMYVLVNNHLPSLIDNLRRPIIISAGIPLIFVPTIDGNLLSATVDIPEIIYVVFYWIMTAIWLGLGIAPITFYAMKRFIGELSIKLLPPPKIP